MMIIDRIDDYCREHGLSARGFELLCGLSNGQVWTWRKKGISPTLTTLRKIEDATGVPVSDWIGGGHGHRETDQSADGSQRSRTA